MTTTTSTSANGKPHLALLRQYYDTLYGTAEGNPGMVCVYLSNGDGKPRTARFISPDKIGNLVSETAKMAAVGDAYCSVDLIAPDAVDGIRRRHGRGKESELSAMVAFRADVDGQKPGSEAKGHYYPPRERILEALDKMPLSPSLVVGSGSAGVHPYWLLHEPEAIDTEAKRGWLKGVSRAWQGLLRRKLGHDADGKPYDLDATADLTRVLRPAGSVNHKHGRPVEIIECHPERRYSVDDFEQFVVDSLSVESTSGETIDETPPGIERGTVIDQARWRLSRIDPPALGGGYDKTTFYAACVLVLGYGLCVDEALPLLREWNTGCQPPWDEAGLLHKLTDASKRPGPRGYLIAQWTNKSEIIIGTDEPRVIDEGIEALATCDNVYQRGGGLVHIVEGAPAPKGIARPEESPRIVPMRYPRIREHLADAAAWYRPTDDEPERVHPPEWVVKAIDARGQWPGIRRLEAVVEAPILRADGSVLQSPGYDPETGVFFRPQCTFPTIPARPTRDDAIHARDALLEVVEDFPFADDAHRAAWLASVLTPLARYAFAGPAPLSLHDANVRGCGKSLLTDATAIITTGREMARMSLPRDDDEFRKRITALAMAGEPLILIDNIIGTFGSASIDAALTATSWSDRILGQTAMASGVPLFATWYATGNNIVLAADTSRRVVHVRLESPEENPEERAGFHHPDLLVWVRRERPRLTAAAVAILAGYCAAGRPGQGLTPWGSFEGWSDFVRSAVVWVGLADPGASRTDLASTADREAVALRQLLEGWQEVDPGGHGITIVDVLHELAERPGLYDGLRAALWELAPPRDGKTLNPRSIGMKLHHLRRRVIGGKCLDRRDTNRGAFWLVRASSDTRDTSDTIPRPPRARTRARTHARENPQATGNSVTSPSSVTDCTHEHVDGEPTHDGYVNRVCRDCGECIGCCRQETTA